MGQLAIEGDTKMKQKDVKQIEKETDQPTTNIFEFSGRIGDIKQRVDPQLRNRAEVRRAEHGSEDHAEWRTVADVLDEAAPNWVYSVKDIRRIGDFVTVTAAITIDGVTREGIGTGTAQSETGIKAAEQEALKQAAIKFPIARDLYKKDPDAVDESVSKEIEFPEDPIARSLGELVTAKQLGLIRALARDLAVDADAECNSVMSCNVDALSKRAASALIGHLQERTADRFAREVRIAS